MTLLRLKLKKVIYCLIERRTKMFNKVSIRVRLTMMSVTLLTLCCVGLTILLNSSAEKIIETVDSSLTIPAHELHDSKNNIANFIDITPYSITSSLGTQAKSTYRLESIFYMFLMIIGGGILTYYVSNSTLKPLEHLNEQVKKINANNLSESLLIPSTHDEISELTKSFNDMIDKLDHSFNLQQQFSINAAHELKTPLAVLQAKIDVFHLKASHNHKEYEDLISVFEKQIYRLRSLVSTLLSMTQTDYENEKTNICLKDVFIDIFEEMTTLANKKNIMLSISCDNSTIYGNLDSLYRAFYNIVENSIKYNLEGGNVNVIIEQDIQCLSIKISDTGIGIPDDYKKDVFEPFFCVDKSRSHEIGGTGLGLSLVKHIINQHGGNIAIYDNHPRGCLLIISFIKK